MHRSHGKRVYQFRLVILGLAVFLILSIGVSVSLGLVNISLSDVWGIAAYRIGLLPPSDWTTGHQNIVWLIRFPRVLLGAIVGAGLAITGATLQALVRNPLADSYILGVSAGASVGAVLAIDMGLPTLAGEQSISLAAFLGAMLALLAVYILASAGGRITPEKLILAGIGVGYFFSGVTSYFTLTSNNRRLAGEVLAWTLGSLSRADWSSLGLPLLAVLATIGILMLHARSLNALMLGDQTATTLGINVRSLRLQFFALTALCTGVLVSVSGAIGFIGLMIPHVVRIFSGADHRSLLPFSALAGSIFLVWVDVAARSSFAPVDAPIELPVGVMTSVLGGAFFLWLMWKNRITRL